MVDYEQFYNEDYIAHYTSLDSAQKILDNNTIRLSNRANALDCIECVFPEGATRISSTNPENEQYLRGEEAQNFTQYNSKRQNQLHQACFCKTGKGESYHSHKLDELCFLHMRMWEQYADNYKGICFILSKERLQHDNPKFIYRDMEYKSLDELGRIRMSKSIDGDKLKDFGADKYKEIQDKEILQMATSKAKDYENEKEFRVMQFSSAQYCYLDISNSIAAVALFRNLYYNREIERIKQLDQGNRPEAMQNLKEFEKQQIKFQQACKSSGIQIYLLGTLNGTLKIVRES